MLINERIKRLDCLERDRDKLQVITVHCYSRYIGRGTSKTLAKIDIIFNGS